MFSQSTCGIGTSFAKGGALDHQFDINGWETSDDSLVQQIKYNQIRFHQTISWKVGKDIYRVWLSS